MRDDKAWDIYVAFFVYMWQSSVRCCHFTFILLFILLLMLWLIFAGSRLLLLPLTWTLLQTSSRLSALSSYRTLRVRKILTHPWMNSPNPYNPVNRYCSHSIVPHNIISFLVSILKMDINFKLNTSLSKNKANSSSNAGNLDSVHAQNF